MVSYKHKPVQYCCRHTPWTNTSQNTTLMWLPSSYHIKSNLMIHPFNYCHVKHPTVKVTGVLRHSSWELDRWHSKDPSENASTTTTLVYLRLRDNNTVVFYIASSSPIFCDNEDKVEALQRPTDCQRGKQTHTHLLHYTFAGRQSSQLCSKVLLHFIESNYIGYT